MKCPYCGSSRFRLSHLRFSDLVHLLVVRYPVRCRLCRERMYAFLPDALRLRGSLHASKADAPIEK